MTGNSFAYLEVFDDDVYVEAGDTILVVVYGQLFIVFKLLFKFNM